MKPIDFQAAPDRARITINDWVAEQTEDRIKDLIPQKVIDELTRMVLTNAIYFNAKLAFIPSTRGTRRNSHSTCWMAARFLC